MSTPSALRIIRDEHQALSAMLTSLRLLLRQHRQEGSPPRFDVIRAMLFYIDEFPERLHHRKETELLFPMIRQHGSEGADILDKLDRDHGAGERAIRELQHPRVKGVPRRCFLRHFASRSAAPEVRVALVASCLEHRSAAGGGPSDPRQARPAGPSSFHRGP